MTVKQLGSDPHVSTNSSETKLEGMSGSVGMMSKSIIFCEEL